MSQVGSKSLSWRWDLKKCVHSLEAYTFRLGGSTNNELMYQAIYLL